MLMLALAIASWQAAVSSGPWRWQITGKVTDSTGAPLAGVRIIDGIDKEVATGSDGRCTVADSLGHLRFLRSGCLPVTKVIERSGVLDIVLETATAPLWLVPQKMSAGSRAR
jgi:hypothetical protein